MLVIFVTIVPFIPNVSWMLLVLHITLVFSLITHWGFNNDACFLTLVESTVRGIEVRESFVHSVVSPIYKIHDSSVRKFVTNITPLLGLVSMYRLYNKRNIVFKELDMLYNCLPPTTAVDAYSSELKAPL